MKQKNTPTRTLLCVSCTLCLLASCRNNPVQEPNGNTSAAAQTTQVTGTKSGSSAKENDQTTTSVATGSTITEAPQQTTTTTQRVTAARTTTEAAKKQTTTAAKKQTTTAAPKPPSTARKSKTLSAAEFAQEVLLLCNAQRTKEGITALQYGNAALQSGADIRAQEARQSFSHTRPDGTYYNTVLEDKGLRSRTNGENLAQYGGIPFTPESLVNGWMNSPAHRDNILNANYRYMALGSSGNTYAQLFFTPLS